MSLKAWINDADVVKEMNVPLFLCAMFAAVSDIATSKPVVAADQYLDGRNLVWNWFDDTLAAQKYILTGIDYGYWSGLLGMTQFQKDFGRYDEESQGWIIPASLQSAGSGLPIAGLAVGSLASGWVGNALGRVRTLQISTVVAVIGVLIQSTAFKSYWQLVVGRVVNAVGLGIMANCIPAYLAEISPLKIRGTLINFYQTSMGIGGLTVSCVTLSTHDRTDQWAYRIVIIIQFIIPVGFLAATFFLPESPRWLVGKDRRAEAEKALTRLRPNTALEVLQEETALIVAQELENSAHFSKSWKECFRGTNFRRTMIVVGVQCLQQSQGNSYMSSYRIIFLQALGMQSVYKLGVLFMLEMVLACACAFYFADRLGRRPILTFTAFFMTATMFITTGVATSGLASDPAVMKGALACMFIWDICMNFGWSSCVWMVTAETPSLQLREKSIMIATFTGFCVSVLVSFVSPFIQADDAGALGARIGYVFAAISIVATIWAFFFLPETGSRSLEELDELFQNKVSVWKFKKYQTHGYGAQLAIIEGSTPAEDGIKAQAITVRVKDQASTASVASS
ncbi:uncharacterized protein A1O9_05549 [Exophiala aquamarina CBS 119918]|uniref:Major facilitator superfamily (MFS) profile domain-containing protein n=1 Tax=Exophiala aquamarina CBS 119918 TaxID=1182545 RepID=A0A072PCQ2_9EURO|nr:uncharacterized protein A1O9_05549 [Exophiala aquamarina CBS 119918]KEF57631.1 hypothetical protein A1O9_05549 [Exophiala aquamarina CBS 119918]